MMMVMQIVMEITIVTDDKYVHLSPNLDTRYTIKVVFTV